MLQVSRLKQCLGLNRLHITALLFLGPDIGIIYFYVRIPEIANIICVTYYFKMIFINHFHITGDRLIFQIFLRIDRIFLTLHLQSRILHSMGYLVQGYCNNHFYR